MSEKAKQSFSQFFRDKTFPSSTVHEQEHLHNQTTKLKLKIFRTEQARDPADYFEPERELHIKS